MIDVNSNLNIKDDDILGVTLITSDGNQYRTYQTASMVNEFMNADADVSLHIVTTDCQLVLLRPNEFASCRFEFDLPKSVQQDVMDFHKKIQASLD